MLNDLLILFIIPLLGAALVFSLSGIRRFHKWLLTFSGAYLISIVFMHILPELYGEGIEHVGLLILVGFFIQVLLDFLSRGIEHGHAHLGPENSIFGVLAGLYLHAFIEGIPLGMNDIQHLDQNHSFFMGILLHKLPISIVLTSLLLSFYKKKSKVLIQIFFFAIIAPLAYLYGHFFPNLIPMQTEQIMAIVVGIFIHVGTTIIFESSDTHSINLGKLIAIFAGFALSVFFMAS